MDPTTAWESRKQPGSNIVLAIVTRRGVRVPVSEDSRRWGEGGKTLMPAQMATNSQTHLRAATMENKRYMMHSFRVGGAAR